MRTITLFIYGSLRQGEAAHHMLNTAPFLGYACTQPCYTLVDLNDYPGLLPNGSTTILGELYEVNKRLLQELDAYEDPQEFNRKPVDLKVKIHAETYFFRETAQTYPIIESGDWCLKH